MKKILMLMVVVVLSVFGCFGNHPFVAKAGAAEFNPEFERLEFDVSQPVHLDSAIVSKFENYHTLIASADIRLNVIEFNYFGKIGIEGTPSFNFADSMVQSNIGVYYEPVKYIQIHYDHASNVPVTNLGSTQFVGSDMVGVRLILINR